MNAPRPARPSGYAPAVQRAYTEGSCWYLGLALAHKAGLPLVAVWVGGSSHHVGALLPGGGVLDIAGEWHAEDWLRFWERRLEHLGDVTLAPVSEDCPHWALAVQLFDESMLEASPAGDSTLGETADALLRLAQAAQG